MLLRLLLAVFFYILLLPSGADSERRANARIRINTQVTAYIPRKLHDETKVNLIRLNNQELSQLIEELLLNWN